MYLYALAGAGGAGVDRAMGLLRDEIERDMLLMGCSSIAKLSPSMLVNRDQ
jgi:L-lactate dehydrogenase (cytochrome)